MCSRHQAGGLCPVSLFVRSHSPKRRRICPRRFFITRCPGRWVRLTLSQTRHRPPHPPTSLYIAPLGPPMASWKACDFRGTEAQLKSIRTNPSSFKTNKVGKLGRERGQSRCSLTSAPGEAEQMPPPGKTVLCLGRSHVSLRSKDPFPLPLPAHTSSGVPSCLIRGMTFYCLSSTTDHWAQCAPGTESTPRRDKVCFRGQAIQDGGLNPHVATYT